MDKVIISTRSEKSKQVVKEARKKAIDLDISFSDAVVQLLEKWIKNEVEINQEVRN
jgi:hypothetical protein